MGLNWFAVMPPTFALRFTRRLTFALPWGHTKLAMCDAVYVWLDVTLLCFKSGLQRL